MLLSQIAAIDWPAQWRGRERFTVFDADYGDGARFQALVQAWTADPARPAHLHVVALERNGALPGMFRLPQKTQGLTLDLVCASAALGLAQLVARFDAVCLHRLSGNDWIRPLARLCRPGTSLHHDGLDAGQLALLAAEGFGGNGFGSRKPVPTIPSAPQRQAIVIGAGLAGAAACERLCARGWQVTLIERHPEAAMEASGNPSGIFMPILSKDDSIPTRLVRAAFLYALRYWDTLGGVGKAFYGAQCGVLHLPRDAAYAATQRLIAQQHRFPPAFAQWLESDAASALLGAPAPDGGWLFPQGGWANPASLCAAMLAACGAKLDARFGVGDVTISREAGQWQVRYGFGGLVASAPVLINAAGAGGTALLSDCALPLDRVRGQVSYLPRGAVPPLSLVVCREAYVTPPWLGVVSLGASYGDSSVTALDPACHQENLNKVGAMLKRPGLGQGAPLAGRVGFRSVAPDRLPLIGALPACSGLLPSTTSAAPTTAGGRRIDRLRDVPRQPGLYCLLGYASRGLTWAPLAAELLAATLDGEPLPLEATLVQALDPARFQLAALRKSHS
jgi:tRNA 5-methylaminomethyl-2-thiouridine biosynthesis bifunctional protein